MGRLDRSENKDLEAALRHPMRRRLLGLLREGAAPSAEHLSGAVGRPVGNVRYHLRVLVDCGAFPPGGAPLEQALPAGESREEQAT